MAQRSSLIITLFGAFLLALCLTSCDPEMSGSLKVFNQSDSVLTVIISDYRHTDSTVYTMEPHTEQVILLMGGLGNKKTFDCCPCELDVIHIYSGSSMIAKDPSNKDNWSIPNKDKLKKFGGENLRCEFYVTASDL